MILRQHPNLNEDRQAIGYWLSTRAPHLPDPRAFVDLAWDPVPLAARLRLGTPFAEWMGYSSCRLCDLSMNGTKCLTFDGSWVWPEGFAHYLETHHVRPPVEFEAYALSIPDDLVEELRRHTITKEKVSSAWVKHDDGANCPHKGWKCPFDEGGFPHCKRWPNGGSRLASCWWAAEGRWADLRVEVARHNQALQPFVVQPWGRPWEEADDLDLLPM